jgi:hypothetical protein
MWKLSFKGCVCLEFWSPGGVFTSKCEVSIWIFFGLDVYSTGDVYIWKCISQVFFSNFAPLFFIFVLFRFAVQFKDSCLFFGITRHPRCVDSNDCIDNANTNFNIYIAKRCFCIACFNNYISNKSPTRCKIFSVFDVLTSIVSSLWAPSTEKVWLTV